MTKESHIGHSPKGHGDNSHSGLTKLSPVSLRTLKIGLFLICEKISAFKKKKKICNNIVNKGVKNFRALISVKLSSKILTIDLFNL